tara:strand:- start:8415 stop:8933 length:519 start_codon:yes stop_codon:yes gene_type:complete
MSRIINLTGIRFGRLLAISLAGRDNGNQCYWNCICDCGNNIKTRATCLRSGDTQSCGCLRNERIRKALNKHGESSSIKKTTEYISWFGMKQRCYNTNFRQYKDYGGRGIKVCERWKESFVNFLEDMGRKPSPQHSLDRINNDGNYEPSNCRWATRSEQQNNKRNNKKMLLSL